ncbi:uncharacterized protein LOC108041346 [Drosophila rhopaloa]|uniref:Uncharacterized protein n=1 Tax=Drosophila rhopaloa TaxID=1041015 RepID=A0ABM5JG47_DRORH|nr:uncharacterized protein LOC108041346 [Drosophila rhopaloa]
MKRYLLSLVFVCLAVLIGVVAGARTYDVRHEDVVNFPGSLIVPSLKRKSARDPYFYGSVKFLKDITNEDKVTVRIYENASGEYREEPFDNLKNRHVCEALKDLYSRFLKPILVTGENTNFNFKNGKVCPLPKGDYSIDVLRFNVSAWNVDWALKDAQYWGHLTVVDKNGEFGGGVSFQVTVRVYND